jgi:hypothetical protein
MGWSVLAREGVACPAWMGLPGGGVAGLAHFTGNKGSGRKLKHYGKSSLALVTFCNNLAPTYGHTKRPEPATAHTPRTAARGIRGGAIRTAGSNGIGAR